MTSTILFAGAAAVGVFLLAHKTGQASVSPPTVPQPAPDAAVLSDVRATMGGPDGAQSQASGGAPVTSLPTPTAQPPSTAYNTAPGQPGWAPTGASQPVTGLTAGTRPFTQTLQTSPKLKRSCGSCGSNQAAIQAAVNGIAPDLRF